MVGKESKMNFAENLKVLREKNGMTQEQLAEKMEVSRQTVSKWESAASFPEMDKMIQLTELFGCTLDGLLNGNMEKSSENEAAVYDRHGNWAARTVAAGVCSCILGLALQCAAEWLFPFTLGETGVPFLILALISVVLFVRLGMESSHFRKKHPYVEPFYTEEEKEAFHRKYASVMTGGIAAVIIAVILMAGLSNMPAFQGDRGGGLAGFLFFLLIAAGVTAIVYIAMQASKYNVEGYNADNAWENSEEGRKNSQRIGKVCGIIMTTATALYVGVSAATNGWDRYWWFFAVGGILCGVAAIFLNRRKE